MPLGLWPATITSPTTVLLTQPTRFRPRAYLSARDPKIAMIDTICRDLIQDRGAAIIASFVPNKLQVTSLGGP